MPKRFEKLEAIHKLNESILTLLDFNKLLKTVLDIMQNTFNLDNSAILLYDEKSEELYIGAAVGYKEEMIKNFRTSIGGRGITGAAAKNREPLYVPNIAEDSRYIPGIEGAKSEIAIPLIVKDQLIGVLDVESKEEYSFSPDDFEVMRIFCSHLSMALHNALVFEREKKKVSQLVVMNEIRKRISVSLDLNRLLQIVAQSMVEFLGYYKILIFTRQEDTKDIKLMAEAGIEKLRIRSDMLNSSANHIIQSVFGSNEKAIINCVSDSQFDVISKEIRSEMAIPISIKDTCIAVIYIASTTVNAFDIKDIHIMDAIADQLSSIIEDAVTYAKANKKTRHMAIINRISKVTIQNFELKSFLDDIAALIHEIFGFYQVGILTYEGVSQQLELVSFAGEPMETLKVGDKISLNEGIVGYVARSGKYYMCNDPSKAKEYRDILLNTKSELAIPIKLNDNVLGVLNLESTKLNQFDETDIEIFAAIADQVAYTMMNAELFRQKSSAHNLLLELNKLSREINSTFDLNKLLQIVIGKLPIAIRCRLSSIFFYYPSKGQLRLMVHNLPDIDQQRRLSLDTRENILMARVIKLQHSIHVKDIEKELHIPNRPRYETRSFLNMLIQHEGRTIGILNLTDKLDHSNFTQEEFYLATSFCSHLSTAIVNSEKYHKILELSINDGLTGLYVHRFFQEALEREIGRSRRYELPLSLAFIDLDDFKMLNDQFGHQIGDIVLRDMGLLIRKEARKADIACRYGGEEFTIILPSTSLAQAGVVARRIVQKIAAHRVLIGRKEIGITASIGVCEFRNELTRETFIRDADRALLIAKKEGKNRVILCPSG